MTKAELMYKAQSLGFKVSKYATKKDIEHIIEVHDQYIRTNELMAKRPRHGLNGEIREG